MNIGKVIKNERESRGWTQRYLAKELGLTPTGLWRIETGRTAPRPTIINKFCELTEYPLARVYIESLEPGDYVSK